MVRSLPRCLRAVLLVGFAVLLAPGCTKKAATAAKCAADTDCAAGNVCVSGACAPAAVAQCGSGPSCSVDTDCTTMQCQMDGCCAATCLSDPDCPDGQACRRGVCSDASGCGASEDCPHMSAPVCNTATKICVRCVTNDQCPAGDVCNSGGCKSVTPPGGCTTDMNCASTLLKRCDTSVQGGRCIACLMDTDCSTDGSSVCDQSVCRIVKSRCDWDGDCAGNPSGKHCARNGQCVTCLTNDQCPHGSRCQIDHTCFAAPACASDASCPMDKPFCRPTDHFCVECYSNSQCMPTADGRTEICRNGYCLPARNGCVSKSDCPATLPVCRATDRTCVGCIGNSDCGAFCQSEVCVGCQKDLDCVESFALENRLFCDSNKACVECIGDVQCNDSTKICDAGRCVGRPENQPCPAGGQCIRDLVCVPDGTPSGTCRTPCDIYAGSDPCLDGTACGLIHYAAGAPVGACVPRTSGAAQLGQACSETQPCDVDGVCIPDAPGSAVCRNRCDPNRSNMNCGPPNKCQYIVQLDATKAPVAVGACFPATSFNNPCANAAGCDPNQICAADGDPANPLALRNACEWTAGKNGAGAPCTHNSECQSDLCLNGMPNNQGEPGFCQGACVSDSDCPSRPDGKEPGACQHYPAPWHGRTGQPTVVSVISCVPQCRDNSECPSGDVCDVVPDRAQTSWVTRCRPKDSTGTKLGGASCYADNECLSSHCFTFGPSPSGICVGVCNAATASTACDAAAQCPATGVILKVGPGPDGRNNTADDVFVPAPVCWGKGCTNDVQCGPPNACGADPDPANPNDIVLTCRPRQGANGGGALCANDSDCRSGYCVTWGASARCFGACDPGNGDADCSGGALCHTGTWTHSTPNKQLSYCAPP
jgi:Cys-rich repeat protein